MLHLLPKIFAAIGALLGAMSCYYTVYAIVGLFATRRFAAARRQHRYAIVIAARNEEAVIGRLLESIRLQDYPSELLTVFVVADNCTDGTAQAARSGGAVCYERCDPDHRTKGYALEYLFSCIARDYGTDAFEGYFVFDADNLLNRDYVSRMNEAFDAGERIVTSCRASKNFGDNWISASYALHWLRTVRMEHRARSVFGLATRIQGTGFLFASELVKNGWHYTSLTEDRAFTADAVAAGYPISYCDAAVFYDEQPVSLRIALRQRIRWTKGHLQAFAETGWPLWKHVFTSHDAPTAFMSYDMFLLVCPRALWSIFTYAARLLCALALWLFTKESFGVVGAALLAWAVGFGKRWLRNAVIALYVFLTERRHMPALPWYRKLWFAVTFPLFDVIGRISTVIALFSHVDWKPIPHDCAAGIDEMQTAKTAIS